MFRTSATFEQNLLKNEITGNFKQMTDARLRHEDVLECTFEQRMNEALQRYKDLIPVLGRIVDLNVVDLGDYRGDAA